MKRSILLVSAALIFIAGCKKTDDAGPGSDAPQQLIPTGTGWQRVSWVPYQNTISGFQGENKMTPYDLTMVGGDLALLYSDDYKMTGVDGHVIMKLMLKDGLTDGKAGAVKLRYDRQGDAVQIHRFIPGSFTTTSMKFENNGCLLYDEAGGPNAGQDFGSINALPALRWYADGTILAGMKDGPHSSAYWDYKYPATGNFRYVVNEWHGDSTSNIASSPMKTADGTVYDVVFSKLGSTVYFSVLKNLHAPQTGSAPNFEIVTRQALPQLDGSKTFSLVTSEVQDDAQTIVIGETEYDGSRTVYKKLHAFRWRKGTAAPELLYSTAISDYELGSTIMTLTTNTSFPNEVRLTPDGTLFFLNAHTPQSSGSTTYTALVLINGTGVREIGRIDAKEMERLKRSQYGLHCCRYFNGAYYAVFHPMFEYEHDKYTPEFRIEVMKIKP